MGEVKGIQSDSAFGLWATAGELPNAEMTMTECLERALAQWSLQLLLLPQQERLIEVATGRARSLQQHSRLMRPQPHEAARLRCPVHLL